MVSSSGTTTNTGIHLVTPAQRHADDAAEVLAKRHAISQAAREANPARWSGKNPQLGAPSVPSRSPRSGNCMSPRPNQKNGWRE